MAKKTIAKKSQAKVTPLKPRAVKAEIVADNANLNLKDITKLKEKSPRLKAVKKAPKKTKTFKSAEAENEIFDSPLHEGPHLNQHFEDLQSDDPHSILALAKASTEPVVLNHDDLLPETDLKLKPAKVIRTATKSGSKAITPSDPLSLYLAEIRKYPLLTREEELELAKKYYETKDPEAAQKLVHSNLRFVVKVAAEYSKFSSKMIDLVQEGNVGLMHAVREFNPYKGARLITYAVWWIKGYIQEYLMRQYSLVRIGTTQNQRKLFYQLQKEKQQLEAMGTEPNIALLSNRLGIPEDEVSEMAQRMSGRDVSLDRPVNEENTTSLADLLRKDDGTLPMDERLELEEQLEAMKEGIEKLRPELSEKEIIILDERLLSDEPLTLQEIGEKYKITREAVRQTEVRVLNKIKSKLVL